MENIIEPTNEDIAFQVYGAIKEHRNSLPVKDISFTSVSLNDIARLIDIYPVAILSQIDENGILNLFNRASSDLFGYAPENVVAKLHTADLVPAEERGRRTDIFDYVRSQRKTVDFDTFRLHKIHGRIPIHAWVFPYELNGIANIAAMGKMLY